MMQKMVSLTGQNQISIPKWIVKQWGEQKPRKLVITKVGDEIRIRPIKNFWSVVGSLKSKITLSNEQLSGARAKFEQEWPREI